MSPRENRLSLRSKILAAIILVVGLVLPAQFWYSVWFGRELSDEEIAEYLRATDHTRKIQHALSQIDQKIRDGDPSVRRWYPQVASLTGHPDPVIRNEAAWVMGQDIGSEAFHESLLSLLEDPDPRVRRNAALALVRHGDRRALPEVRRMLRALEVVSPAGGKVEFRVRPGQWVSPGDELVDVGGEVTRARFPGRVLRLAGDGSSAVREGDFLLEISPDPQSVWEGLRALVLLGEPEDMPLLETIAQDRNFDEQTRQQAELARKAIASR